MTPRVACISHGSIVALNRRPYDILATQLGLDLTVVVPDRWLGDLPNPSLRFAPGDGGPHVVPMPARVSGNGSLYWLTGLRALLHRLDPDVLLLDEEPWSLVAWQALRALGRRRASVVFYSKQNIVKRLLPPFSAIRRATYGRARSAWAVGETTAEVLRTTGFMGHVDLVPHGVDTSRFSPGRDEERRRSLGLTGVVVGFVGRLVPEKGVAELLEAARLMRESDPGLDFTVLVVGAGPMGGEVGRAAASGSLKGHVRAVGAVPHDEAPGIYRLMDVFVLPSRSTARWREQFGRALVEAAATALPVVAAGSGEIPHVVDALGGGVVVPEADAAALAAAIHGLVADGARRRGMGQRNLAAARLRFSQEAIAERMAGLLRAAGGVP